MVVEDDLPVLALISEILESSGHVILKASAASQAFQKFEEVDASVDLVIADVNLPGTSGLRMALEFWSLLPNLSIILTSGHTPDMWNEDEFLELTELPSDCVAVLQKPFLPAALLETVSRFVSVPRPGFAVARAS